MEYRNRMKTRLLLLFCVLTAACLLFGSVSAAITAEATGACTNATYEGIEYFVPYTANSERSDDWRTNLTVKVKDRPAGNAAGEVIAMEVVMVNGSTRYQCTQVLTEEFSCNSLPKNGLISGISFCFRRHKNQFQSLPDTQHGQRPAECERCGQISALSLFPQLYSEGFRCG